MNDYYCNRETRAYPGLKAHIQHLFSCAWRQAARESIESKLTTAQAYYLLTARLDSLKMKSTTTPFFGSDIGDGFSEIPAVAVKVLSIVLALAIGLLLRFSQDDGSIPSCALAVTLSIFDANLNDMRIIGRHMSFGDGETPLAGLHLDAVIGDAETGGEAKGLCQPIGCRRGVRINEHRNHGAGWHRSVESHLETLSPQPARRTSTAAGSAMAR